MGKTLGYGEITVANMTEPFTVMLTNEAQQFATDSNRKVTSAQSYYTDIIVIRGSQERTDYTIGNITSGSGIAVSKSSKRVTFSVSAGTTIGADAGVIEIPITLDGQTVKKQFSWSCGKQGPQGVQGIQGNDGNSFAWNMLSETNCGKKHWGTMSSGGKYSVEDFITEDNINAVKLICTESVSSSEWSYTCFTDLEMLKQLKPSTKYTLSYDIKANRSGMISHTICRGNITNSCTNTVVVSNIIGDETWQHISVVLTTNDLKTTPTNEVVYLGRTALSKVGYSIIKNLKLAEGDIDTPWSPSQSDIEGKGVAEIVQYYLTTSQASGVTSSTSGWSTDITTQKLTADKKYLWNCYQTRYSDGTSEPISTPKVIGVYGDKGQKGDNAKNLSITPSSQYFKSTDGGKTFAPNAITIKPTIQGEISFGKWQYSIDGGVSFADVVSGQKGLTVSNNVLAVSKDSSLYSDAVTMVTFRAVANDSSFYDTCSIAKIYDVSDIGDGRNLWITRDDIALQACTKDKYSYTTTGTSAVCIGADTSSVGTNKIALQLNNKYTISFVIAATSAVDNARWYFCTSSGGKGVKNYGGYTIKLSTGDNIVTQTITLDTACDAAGLVIYNLPTGCIIKDIQVEKGSSPTGWTPAPEDVQTAILSTKSEISSVSSKVDQNTKSIEDRVEKTTYERELTLVKGDISKANEGLNKWRYEIYPKSLFASEYQGKSTMDVFAKNTNLTPSQSVLINDTDLSIAWNYDNNYIGYALTFVKFSAAKSVAITFAHDDGAHIYLNGKLIGGGDAYNQTGESLTLGFVKGWNCIEVVVNEGANTEGFKLGTTISAISECQLMNCYYGTPVARQSHITNQLVENTTNIEGVTTKVGKVTSVIGENGENFTSFQNDYSDFKQTMNGFKTTVGQTYVTKDDFNGLEIGGRNLILNSAFKNDRKEWSDWGNPTTRKIVSSNGKMWAHIVGNKQNYQGFNQWTPAGSIKEGDHITFSARIKGSAANQKFSVGIHWINSGNTIISQDWHVFTVDTTESIYTWTIDAKGSGCNKLNLMVGVSDTSASYNVYFTEIMVVKGNKATDWTPAPEDNEINGQNLVSNLPTNWEQGSINYTANLAYSSLKSTLASRLRTKDVFPVSGNITISAGTSTNSSKEALNFYYVLFDINKKSISHSDTWQSLTSAKIINCGDAKYMAIILKWDSGTTTMNPSDISQICLKIERGTSATPFTLAPEDVNGKIVNVETIANQTAKKFEWIVKGGDKSSSMVLTDDFLNIVANNINLTGKVTFESFDKSTQDKLNSPTSGNLITVNPTNPTSNYSNTSFTVTGDDAGGRCIQSTASFVPFTNYASNIFKPGEQIYYNICVPNWSSTTFNANLGIWFFTAEKKCVANSCKSVTLTRTTWNKLSGYITVPSSGWSGIVYYVIGIENPNKYQLGLVSNSYIEKTNSYASTYASGAVNWVTSNGKSITSLNSMVKKWTDGAISDTTQINGGWIKANTITASKIALADFTNYSQLTRDTADMYGFTVTDDTNGTWFVTKTIKRDLFISKLFPCNGGESYLIEYDISTNMKASDTASDTKNYRDTAIGVYCYTGDINSNGEPTKATNIWYATRVTGSSGAPVTHIKTAITTSTTTKQFRIFLQSNGYYFEGTTKIRNLSVRRMYGGTLIVDGSITANKIATDAIKSRNYISSGGTQGSFLNLSDGSFTSPNLSWDSNGNLIATGANLSGKITATKGKIGSFNLDKSLYLSNNSPYYFSQFCAKKVYGLTNEGDIYIGSEGIYSYSWETGNMYIGDSGSIQADVSSSRGVCIENGEIHIYKSDYCKDYPTACDNKYGLVLAGGYVASANYSDGGSIDGFNFILSPNKFNINGKIYASNELQTGGNQVRIISGNIGCMLRNDSVDFYILRTNSGDPYGGWTDDRPFRINWASNDITCGHNLTANDLIANSWLYCSEVHSSGAVVIGADSESFYWAHGFQIARGTSWGGVCIGDDSHQLRLYGSSIWASHSISTSDENLKENFTTLDQYEDFYMNLNPIGFNYIGDYDGKKTHFGFGAHKTENILESEGYDANKFAVVTHRPLVQEDIEKRFGKDVEVDIETEYGVSYTEFIALNTHMIQKTRRELTKVKQEKADLEARLQAIEARLGL